MDQPALLAEARPRAEGPITNDTGHSHGAACSVKRSVSAYLLTQQLAGALEKAGLAGIRHPSAMAPGGTNVVLFDPVVAEVGASSLVEIVDARIEYEDVEGSLR